ncbi:hypothetical protein ACKUB1_15920 [Methanospirillum stamsii]|uniref:Uncharacterized protein n=1 Tax=Methanospirillum stamsii TaxID=1277351 RepID=A0A2V2MV15_9EURY|nr:hypothetical protein [Methanospirillum stamsii]PWR71762.1 hypothetical protein DLD82_13510 [Methanospirillum stamsii]
MSEETYSIDISPSTVETNETVKVVLEDIPQNSIINMTIEGEVSAVKGEESTFLMTNFLFPYYDPAAVYETHMMDLIPGTEATTSVIREDGTEASYTGEVNETGIFNASIIHELNRAVYNVTFTGIPAEDHMRALIEFGSTTREDNSTEEATTAESSFTPSGFFEGKMDVSVYIDGELQKTETISVTP